MPETRKAISVKTPRVVIGFRHSRKIKERLVEIAADQNLDPASIYRTVFNAGLKELYGFKIAANELVDESVADRNRQ